MQVFLTDIELNGNKLQSLVIEGLNEDPLTNVIEGRLYYNVSTKLLRYYNGTNWQNVTGGGGGGDDELFRINSSDAVSGYHEDKILNSESILWTTEGGVNKTRKAEINPEYNFDFTGNITFDGSINFGAAVTVDVNQNINNLLIPNLGGSILVRLNFTANYSLTGIVPTDLTKGQWIIAINVGAGQGIFKDNDAGSTPENRFLLGANKTVQTNEGVALVYDTVDQRWRSFAINI